MAARAESDYPRETCGLVFEKGGRLEVAPMRNIQDQLHREDPAAHPRDARTAYAFDPAELVAALADREAAGETLRAIYHSHPDHDAYFSETDRREAAPPEWGGPTYPGAIYLVFSVRSGKLREARGFAWSDELKDFAEVAVRRVTGREGPATRGA